MEYDDGQFDPLFVSQKIEEVLKQELAKDVDARHYEEFQKQLEVDLHALATAKSVEEAKKFITTKLGKFSSASAAQTQAHPQTKGQPQSGSPQEEENDD